jgi:hypothetical protein
MFSENKRHIHSAKRHNHDGIGLLKVGLSYTSELFSLKNKVSEGAIQNKFGPRHGEMQKKLREEKCARMEGRWPKVGDGPWPKSKCQKRSGPTFIVCFLLTHGVHTYKSPLLAQTSAY